MSSPGSDDEPPQGEIGRQAVAALGGYVYQVYASTLAWLRLSDGELLYLEVAEDYAIASRGALTGVQVKNTAGSGRVTLQTEDVRTAIDTFVDLVSRNPDRVVSLRYLTTAEIGHERMIEHRVPKGPALAYWRQAALFADSAPLRSVLLKSKLKQDTLDFIAALDEEAFRSQFLKRIHWLCGAPNLADLISDIDDELIEFASTQRRLTSSQARRLRPALAEKVLSVASGEPPRRLRKKDLLELIDRHARIDVPIGHYEDLVANQRDKTVPQEALLAPPAVASSQDFSPANISTMRQTAEELLSVLDQIGSVLAENLQTALEDDRAGRSRKLREWLRQTRSDEPRWNSLSAETRAKALRAQAVLALRDVDVATAEGLFDQADELSAPVDRSDRAMALSVKGEPHEAIKLLSDPVTAHERELRAGLLLETGDLESASRELEGVAASEVTAEIVRLRAILAMLNGDRVAALRFASSAVERGRGAFAPLMTRGAIRFFCALTPGAAPQFGGRLQPVHPGLLAEDATVRRNLDLALADFDRLIEGDRPETSEVETWRLGSLLLHPDLADEADFTCRQLLRRDPVDPIVVMWCWSFGRLQRLGKTRKSLGDAVRQGKGSETHLIAWATLSAGASRPERGLSIIKQHQDRYPKSRALLDSWRIRFGDETIEPSTPYERAMRKAVAGDYGSLVERLRESSVPPAEVAVGADFLASRSAWTEVVSLRPVMLSVATPRVLRLAAAAALQVEDAAGCLEVIAAAEGALNGLPPEFRGLRIRAFQMLGQYQPLIDDLRAIRGEPGSDPKIGGLLLDVYYKIGALADFADEARRSMAAGELDPHQTLNVAHVMRGHDQELASQALQKAVEAGVGAEALQNAFVLAIELGQHKIQKEIVETSGRSLESQAVRSFQTVEELLGYLEERNEAYRTDFERWLRGEVPAAVAMLGDLKGFARLFLADPAERENLLRERFPMLLLSGGRRKAPLPQVEECPVLRLDLSALLLAAKLDMLDAVEQAFVIETPVSLSEALADLDDKFVGLDPEVASRSRKTLAPAGPLRVVDAFEPDWVSLDGEEETGGLDPQALRRVSEAAFSEGHLDPDQLAKLQALIAQGAGEVWGTDMTLRESPPVTVSRRCFWRLASSGMLEQLSRSTEIYIQRSEFAALVRGLHEAEADARIKATIGDLRRRVTNRLMTGKWTGVQIAPSHEHAPAPAHIRCLMELLWKQEREPTLLWIEDRAVSHNPHERALCVTEVLAHLRRSGVVDHAWVKQRVNRLMTAGYAYLPVEALEASRKLLETPLGERGLVETPELVGLQSWYAQESQRLGWLDATPRHDREGRVVGEIRRALDLDLAHTTLIDIWGQAPVDQDYAAARARSEWAWARLRQQAPYAPSKLVDSHVRNYVAIHLAHALTIPLSSELTPKPLSRSAQSELANWFVDSVIAPLERADPETFELVMETVAQSVSRIIDLEGSDDTGMDDDLRERLARRMNAVAGRFLDLLPDRMIEHVLDHGGLRETLPRRTFSALPLTDDVSLPLESFTGVAETLLAAGVPKTLAVTLSDGKPARLEARFVDDELELAVVLKKRRFAIAAETRAIVHPDEASRLAGVELYFLDRASAVSRDRHDAVMRLPTAQERFDALKRLRSLDFYYRSRLVRSKVERRQRLAVDDLTPPSVEEMSRFLRSSTADMSAIVSREDVLGLSESLGARPALERLASRPTGFSSEALLELGARIREEAPQSDPNAIVTPAEALLRLRAALAAKADLEELRALVAGLAASFERNGKLFVALIRYGALAACRMAEWRELSPEAWTGFVWAYADQMLRAIAPDYVDAQGVAAIIAGQSHRTFRDIAAVEKMPRWAREISSEMSADRLILTAVAALIGDGASDRDFELLDPLQFLIGREKNNAWWPPTGTLAPPPEAPANIWPARDVVPALIAGGWLPPDHPFAVRDHDVIARRIMDDAPLDEARHLRSCMLSHVDASRVSPETLARIRSTLVDDPVAAGLEPQMIGAQMVLSAWADVLAQLDDSEGFTAVVSTFARRCASRWPTYRTQSGQVRPEPSGALHMVADSALEHVLALPRSRFDQLTTFSSIMTAVAAAWPSMSREIASVIRGLADAAEAPDAVPLWRAASRLIACAGGEPDHPSP